MTAFQPEQIACIQHCVQNAAQLHPELRTRIEKGAMIALFRDVRCNTDGTWLVPSETTVGLVYTVTRDCPCADALYRAPGGWCKHQIARALILRSEAALPQPQPETVQPVACEVCGDPALLDAPSAHDGLARFCASCYDVVREARAEHQHPCHVSGCRFVARTHMELAGHSADMHGWHNYDASAQERAESRVAA